MKTKLGKYEKIKECPEIGYLIGAIWGDGSTYIHKQNGKIISLKVKDKEFSDRVSDAIFRITGSRPPRHYYERNRVLFNRKNGKTYKWLDKKFIIQIKSDSLYDLIKSKKRCLKYINRYPLNFLRGIYDAEGCVFLYGKERDIPKVKFGVKDKKLIDLVSYLLQKIKIEYTIRKRVDDCYVIEIRSNSTKLFQKKIDFRINRKHQRLIGNKEYFPTKKYKNEKEY